MMALKLKPTTTHAQADRLCALLRIVMHGPVPVMETPKGAVIVTIKPWQDEVILDKLIAIDGERKGAGTSAMNMICDAADQLGITLTLAAVPLKHGKGAIPARKLIRFYHSFGFVGQTSDSLRMKRTPR